MHTMMGGPLTRQACTIGALLRIFVSSSCTACGGVIFTPKYIVQVSSCMRVVCTNTPCMPLFSQGGCECAGGVQRQRLPWRGQRVCRQGGNHRDGLHGQCVCAAASFSTADGFEKGGGTRQGASCAGYGHREAVCLDPTEHFAISWHC